MTADDGPHTALLLVVALLATTAGCSSLGGVVPGGQSTATDQPTAPATDQPTATDAEPTLTATATPAPTATPTPTPMATPTPTLDVPDREIEPVQGGGLQTGVTLATVGYANETGRQIERALADGQGNASRPIGAQDYHLQVDTRVVYGGQTVVTNQTLRVNGGTGRAYVRTERTVEGENSRTVEISRYSNGSDVYVQYRLPDGGATYYYQSSPEAGPALSAIGNDSSSMVNLDRRIDFDRSSSGDMTYLTADSADQFYPSPAREDVRNVSVRVVIDEEENVVWLLRYHVELAGPDGGTVVYDRRWRLQPVEDISVPEPSWMPEARNRTAG